MIISFSSIWCSVIYKMELIITQGEYCKKDKKFIEKQKYFSTIVEKCINNLVLNNRGSLRILFSVF